MTALSSGGERVGLLCAGSPAGQAFGDEDAEIARAVAHLAAVAIKRAELIEGLTNANIIKDLFEALAAGAAGFAATKAAEVRCDLTAPYMILLAEPVSSDAAGSGEWRATAEALGRELAELAPRSRDRVRTRAGAGAADASPPRGRRASTRCCATAASSASATAPRSASARSAAARTRHPAPTARPATPPRSPAPCSATAARSPIRRSAPTATWCRSPPTTPRATACAPPSTC